MIQVVTQDAHGNLKPLDFDTNAVEVMDGALVVYTWGARDFWAGFAPGQWLSFERLDVGDG